MRPRDLFGLAVRVIGVWFLTQAFYWFCWAGVKSHAPDFGNPRVSVPEELAYASIYLLLGGLMLLLADPIVWVVYGLPPKPPEVPDSPKPDA